MRNFFFVLAILLASGFSQITAQPPKRMAPPPVLLIVREDIKPGKMPAHNIHSASFARIFRQLQTPSYRIALVPVAGSENEVIYITALDTFKEIEETGRDTDKKLSSVSGAMKSELDRLQKEAPDLHAGMRDMFAVYRPDLSYDATVDIRQMRYFAINTVRVRPGQEDQFAEYDLRIGPRVREAMSDDQKKKADKLAGESVVFSETSVYAFNPKMSYVDKDFAAGDPTFWNPKPEAPVITKRVTRKKTAKPPAGPTTP